MLILLQKFEQTSFREKTSEYYAKHHISWQIMVYIIPTIENGQLKKEFQVHVQIIEEGGQNWPDTCALMESSIGIFHKGNPDITTLIPKSGKN